MKYIILIIFTLFSLCSVKAQSRFVRYNTNVDYGSLSTVSAYMDSLRVLRHRVDSMQKVNDSIALMSGKKADSRFYRLFSPITFDPKVTARLINNKALLSQSDADEEIDDVLLYYYFNRPDLIQTSVSRLHKSAAKGVSLPSSPVKRKVEVVKETGEVDEAQLIENMPVDIKIFKPNFWTFNGDYSLQFLQNYISDNWYRGGESNLSAVGNVVLKANYNNKQKVKFDNTLELKLGMQTSESDTVHTLKTSTDVLRYTGKLGLQAIKKWDYAFQVIATTQMMRTYRSNNSTVYSDFCSPLEVNFSIGMDYTLSTKNRKLTGSVHLAPLAYNFKYVGRLALSTRNGLQEGSHTLDDWGSQMTVNLTWKPAENIKWNSRLYAYTTYERAVVEIENTITFVLSKFISTNLFLYPRFDDGGTRKEGKSYWQMKEYLALGFSYSM